MSGNRPKVVSNLQNAVLPSSIEFIGLVSRFRNQIIATITLTALLVAIFQAEVLTANLLGYSSSQTLLDSLSRETKIFLTATVGPFIHQGPGHLTNNLGILLVAGTYLEYEYNRYTLYTFYLGVGYLAAWAPLTLGFTGAVGASGVTYGLTIWLLVHSISRPLEMGYDGVIDRRVLHLAPLLFGLIKTREAIATHGMMDGADDVTHFFGAFVGLLLGIYFVLVSCDFAGWLQSTNERDFYHRDD